MTDPLPPSPTDPLSDQRALTRAELPELALTGVYEYVVVSSSENSIDASPTDRSLGLPPITGMPCRFGIPGTSATVAQSSICLVMFVNQQASRPVIVAYDSTTAVGVRLASGADPVARLGDTVQVMVTALPPNLTGTIQFVGAPSPMQTGVPYAIAPLASSLIILSPVSGTVTTGSSQVATK